ncbi:hypothetical protein FA15DRAFT_757394 [Coprinopsis marcescibilis]|uniref:Uncharacterized protein n=1 Tax=Coprinopsis marcescibilis TaxID=230819 RepID=A0A5C3KS58_COPMA|nr:hypothetical protein FA15DRAFT_757394 [Coprinopsis marcescibilis]
MNPFGDASYLDQPPPPAYSEQEFDQKVSRAVELSTDIRDPIFEDVWEEYDPAAFEAAAATYETQNKQQSAGSNAQQSAGSSSGSSGSSSTQRQTQPLRIHKKTKSDPDYDVKSKKDEPKWLAAANEQTGGSSSSHSASSKSYNAYDGDDIAPPPFADEAPAQHQVYQRQTEYSSGMLTPAAAAHSSANVSRSSSPSVAHLSNPPQAQVQPQTYSSTQFSLQQPSYRQSMPISPSTPTNFRHGHRPYSELSPSTTQFTGYPKYGHQSKPVTSAAPVLQFNPSVAYGKSPVRHRTPAIQQESAPQPVFSAAAFYNSAVSAHLQSTPTRPTHSSSFQTPNHGYNGQPRYGLSSTPTGGFHNPPPSQHLPSPLPNTWQASNRATPSFSSSYENSSNWSAPAHQTSFRPSMNNWQNQNGYR